MRQSTPSTSTPDDQATRQGLARLLAETSVDLQAAEYAHRDLIHRGHDHMMSRYGVENLEGREGDLDHYAFHMGAMADAIDGAGLGMPQSLPYVPATGGAQES